MWSDVVKFVLKSSLCASSPGVVHVVAASIDECEDVVVLDMTVCALVLSSASVSHVSSASTTESLHFFRHASGDRTHGALRFGSGGFLVVYPRCKVGRGLAGVGLPSTK